MNTQLPNAADNVSLICVYNGTDDPDSMSKTLGLVSDAIHELHNSTINVADTEYTIKIKIVADMKCLACITGMYSLNE